MRVVHINYNRSDDSLTARSLKNLTLNTSVEIRLTFTEDDSREKLIPGTVIIAVLKQKPEGDLLAKTSAWTVPIGTVGYYRGRLNLTSDQLIELFTTEGEDEPLKVDDLYFSIECQPPGEDEAPFCSAPVEVSILNEFIRVDDTGLPDPADPDYGWEEADQRYYTQTEVDELLAAKAAKASPAFSGVPTAPTADLETNSAQLATTAFVKASVAAQVPGTFSYDAANGLLILELSGGEKMAFIAVAAPEHDL